MASKIVKQTPEYSVVIWKFKKEYHKVKVQYPTKIEATAYACGMYDAIRKISDVTGYTVKPLEN